MISEKQLAANRQNALNSTGPTTIKGKARSSKNATKHGILSKHVLLSTESKKRFNSFRRDMFEALAPKGALEVLLADRVVVSAWRLQRVIEAQTDNLEGMVGLRRSELKEVWTVADVNKELGLSIRNLTELDKTYLTRGRRAKCQDILNRYEEPKLVPIAAVFRKEARNYCRGVST